MITREVPEGAVQVQGLSLLFTFQSVCQLKLWSVVGHIAGFEPILGQIKEWAANGWFGEEKNDAERLTMEDVFSLRADFFNNRPDGGTLRVFFANLLVLFGKSFAGEFGPDSDDAHQYINGAYWDSKTRSDFLAGFYRQCVSHLTKIEEETGRPGSGQKPKVPDVRPAGPSDNESRGTPKPEEKGGESMETEEKGRQKLKGRRNLPVLERAITGVFQFDIVKVLRGEYGIRTVKKLTESHISLFEKKGSMTSGRIATCGFHLLLHGLSFADGPTATREYVEANGDQRILKRLQELPRVSGGEEGKPKKAVGENLEPAAPSPPPPAAPAAPAVSSTGEELVAPAMVQSAPPAPAEKDKLPQFLKKVAQLLETPGFRGCECLVFAEGRHIITISIASNDGAQIQESAPA